MVSDWPFSAPSPFRPSEPAVREAVASVRLDGETQSLEPVLVDAKQAAEMLGVTLNNLRQMVFKKKLTVMERQGRRVYFTRDSIVDYLNKRSGHA